MSKLYQDESRNQTAWEYGLSKRWDKAVDILVGAVAGALPMPDAEMKELGIPE